MKKTLAIDSGALESLVNGGHGAPFDILGPHKIDASSVSVRVFRPDAKSIDVVDSATEKHFAMRSLHKEGFYEAVVSKVEPENFKYTLEITTHSGDVITVHDPYAFTGTITDFDRHLFNEGNLLYAYQALGAHLIENDGVSGVRFAVWAPNAHKVSIMGDFNQWDTRTYPMRLHGVSGIWELFVPDIGEGVHYKYDIHSRYDAFRTEKADPYGFYAEVRPRTASIVYDMDKYKWNDSEWMKARAESNLLNKPMSIYEVHLGSWRRKEGNQWLSYRELADELLKYIQEMGYTHIELLPVSEHPFDGSWGYQVTGYYAPTSRFGSPDDFKYFVDAFHQAGIGIILDWVPAHFPKDGFALSYFDGTHLYEHSDARLGEHPDWGTYIFNYGRNEVSNFLISNALYWLKEFHIDGLRVDAVSSMLYLDFGREDGQWIPNKYGGNENLDAIAFLKRVNEILHSEMPGAITIAEESTSWAMVSRPTYIGGLGFTFKWNMGWMHDTLQYISKDPVYRRYHHNTLTFSMMYAFSENFVLSLSHDEVVHLKGSIINKVPGDWWQKLATVRLLYGYQFTHPGKKLNFMGQEIGQYSEWSEERSLDWHLLDWPTHSKLHHWVKDILTLYKNQPALYEVDYEPSGFQWLEANDNNHSVFAYVRYAQDPNDFIVVIFNFTPVVRENYRIGVPQGGHYTELLNSDSEFYGGGNVGNFEGCWSQDGFWQGQPHSISVTVPPLGIVLLKRD